MMLQPIEQSIDQGLLVEQIIPVRQIEICGDDCCCVARNGATLQKRPVSLQEI